MVDGGSVCHWYICILLYVKLIGCNGVAWMYGWLEGVCLPWVYLHSFYMWNLLGVMVKHGCIEGGSICHWLSAFVDHSSISETYWLYGYMCILLYSETYWLYWCSMNLWLIEGRSICHGYICILWYVKLIGCDGVAWIYGINMVVQRTGDIVHNLLMGISFHLQRYHLWKVCVIMIKLMWVWYHK